MRESLKRVIEFYSLRPSKKSIKSDQNRTENQDCHIGIFCDDGNCLEHIGG